MSKELEALERIRNKFIDFFHEDVPDFDILEQALQCLEAIENVNPSEALECVEDLIFNFSVDEYVERYDNNLQVIKNYILKAQEPKQYLKWEDLDFKEVSQLDHKIIKAKLNEQLYELDLYRYGGYKRVEIRVIGNSYNYNLGEGYVVCIDEEFPETIQFFNDLHLERVENSNV